MAMSTFGTSPGWAAPGLTRAKGITRESTEGCTTPSGQSSSGSCTPSVCGASPPSPHPIPSRASWEVGNGKDLSVGRQECPSQPCPTRLRWKDMLSPQERRSGRGETAGDGFFGCLFGFARSGAALEESQIPCTPS